MVGGVVCGCVVQIIVYVDYGLDVVVECISFGVQLCVVEVVCFCCVEQCIDVLQGYVCCVFQCD